MKIILFVLVSFAALTSFARDNSEGEVVFCESKNSNLDYVLDIGKSTIKTMRMDRNEPKETWSVDRDPGLYRYFAVNSKKPEGNGKTITLLRLDFSGPIRQNFEMEIAFIWYDLEYDHSGFMSKEIYKCQKR